MNEGIERIKILASEIKDNATLKIINYLLTRKDMNEKYLNEEKSLKQMIDFIKSKAEKQAKNGMAIIDDKVVYGWAIHYWDESNEDLNIKKKEKTDKIENQQETKKGENKGTTKSKKWVPEGQLSLFDMM